MNDERWTDEVGEPFANDCFAPERWLTEKGKHTAGWLPFGAGERMCLGYQIAMSELKVCSPTPWILTHMSHVLHEKLPFKTYLHDALLLHGICRG